MYKLLFFGFLSVLLFSCGEEEVEPVLVYPDYILAGETTGHRTRGVLYTDIEPVPRILADNYRDLPIYEEYEMDLNADGEEDFLFVRSRSFSDDFDSLKIRIVPLNQNQTASAKSDQNLVYPFNLVDTIDTSSDWIDGESILYDLYLTESDSLDLGLWRDIEDKYIGTRIRLEDKYLYGWIRIAISSGWGDNLVVFDFATTVGYSE